MKKIIFMFFMATLVTTARGAIDTEKQFWFSSENLAVTIPKFVQDKNLQKQMVRQYMANADAATGRVSMADLFDLCETAGFRPRSGTGYERCRAFVVALLEYGGTNASDDFLDGYCPESGNALDINETTHVGDLCTSSQIAVGEVIWRRGYGGCTCQPMSCQPGFMFDRQKYQCVAADPSQPCPRAAYPKTAENGNTQRCVEFCGKKAAARQCKYTSVVMSHSTGQCICNPAATEVDAARQSMLRATQQRTAKLAYYEVCGNHRGKSGGTEYCITDVFDGVNTNMLGAIGLATEYARIKNGATVHCHSAHRTKGNDDYVKCTSSDGKKFYEFKFDDVTESVDGTVLHDTIAAICEMNGRRFSDNDGLNCTGSCAGLKDSFDRFGYSLRANGANCQVHGFMMTQENAENRLAKIDGIDNYVFFGGIEISAGQTHVAAIRDYLKAHGVSMSNFRCDAGYRYIAKSNLYDPRDDIIRCYVDNRPIDFVFDDINEAFKYKRQAGDAGMDCIVAGGVYQGEYCHGLSREQCAQAGAALQTKYPGSSGTKWSDGMCVLNDVAEAQLYDFYVNFGIGLVSAADCLVLTHTGCAVATVEIGGILTEAGTDLAVSSTTAAFLRASTQCHTRACAKSNLKNLGGSVLSVKDAMSARDVIAVDSEMARLVNLLEPADFGTANSGDWASVIEQLGGDPDDARGTTLTWINRLSVGAQFASISVTGMRLTNRALLRIGNRAVATSGGRVVNTINNITDGYEAQTVFQRIAN